MINEATLLGLLLGLGLGVGLLLLIAGWRGWSLAAHVRGRNRDGLHLSRGTRLRIGLGLIAATVVALVTRWPMAALGAAVVVIVWPRLFGGAGEARRELAQLEALALWTESLRDTIAGAIGLEQAIPATSENAPEVLAVPLDRLVSRLKVRTPLPEALQAFADDLDDPGGDLVVSSLIVNARVRGPGLRDTLGALAVATREELKQRSRAEARRRSLRRSARIIVGITIGFAGFLSIFAREWLSIYDTAEGQLALAVVFAIFAAGFAWISQLSRTPRPPRFLIGNRDLRPALTGE